MIRSSEYDKLELKHQNLVFKKLVVCIIKKKCHGVKQKCKNMPLVKQNVMKFEVFILGGQRNDQKKIRDGGERGLRWKQDRDREKRDKR